MDKSCYANICILHVIPPHSPDTKFRFLGIFASLLIPETKRKTLEELTGKHLGYITKSRRGTLPSDGGRRSFRKFGAEVLEESRLIFTNMRSMLATRFPRNLRHSQHIGLEMQDWYEIH